MMKYDAHGFFKLIINDWDMMGWGWGWFEQYFMFIILNYNLLKVI